MKGTYLRVYMHENRKHHHILLYEWLLEQAKKSGIHGGSAFRAVAGDGPHGFFAEQPVFAQGGALTVMVEFLLSDDEAQSLLDLIEREKVRVFYAKFLAEFGVTEGME